MSIFSRKPQTYLLRVFFPVKCKRWEDIITLRFTSRKENKRETRKRNPPLSPSRRDAREKREVKGACERLRDDDPYFCHLGFPSSLTRKSIRERERNHNHKPSRAKRSKAKKAKKRKTERERQKQNLIPCSRWKQRRRQ